MGAWAAGILDDDTALDVLDELRTAPDPRPMMTKAFAGALESGYIEYDECHWVLVSAAIIAHVSAGLELEGLEAMDDDGTVQAWVDGVLELDFSMLRTQAAQACDKVSHGESELRELWSENEALFPQWQAQGAAIVQALSVPGPTGFSPNR